MSMNHSKKIDKFYFVVALVVIVLAIPLIITAQGIFSAYITSFELQTDVQNKVRINKKRLNDAISSVENREVVSLEVRESTITTPVEPEDAEDVDDGQ